MLILTQSFGLIITIVLGVIAVSSPKAVEKFVSIQAVGKSGLAEIRATYGGFFLGLSLFALYSQDTLACLTIGFGWVGAAFVRACTLFLGSCNVKNAGAVAFELSIGLLCLSSLIGGTFK